MKKFINKPEAFVDDMLGGVLAAHPERLRHLDDDLRFIVRADAPVRGKVGLATGGGSGHLPLFLGYVGLGLLDGCAVGEVFQSPSADQILKVTEAVDGGKGVLYIYGNYSGDVINFDMAGELAQMQGLRVEASVVCEDVSSAPPSETDKRRGVAGTFFVYKCAGAKAAEGVDLDEVKRIADKAGANVRTMGVALSPLIVPEVGRPSFTIEEGQMELGMGIHGEPGVRRGKLLPADEVVSEMMANILPDLPYENGNDVAVLVNGLGSTPLEELYIVYRKTAEILHAEGISVFRVYVGEFATSLEMTGMSISILKVDDELKELLRQSASTPFFEQLAF